MHRCKESTSQLVTLTYMDIAVDATSGSQCKVGDQMLSGQNSNFTSAPQPSTSKERPSEPCASSSFGGRRSQIKASKSASRSNRHKRLVAVAVHVLEATSLQLTGSVGSALEKAPSISSLLGDGGTSC